MNNQPATYRNLREVAKAHSRSVATIHKWTKHEEWPCTGRALNRQAIAAFHAAYIAPRHADAPESQPAEAAADEEALLNSTDPRDLLKLIKTPSKRIQMAAVIERMMKGQVEREMLLGGYLKKDDVQRERLERIQAVRQEMANIRLLAIKMEGQDLIQRETILEDWARGICNRFARE